jgi:dihydrofolate synthase/folylpolyglutamate synthase
VYGAPGPPASIASRAAGLGAPLLERERDFAFAADPDTATWALRGRDRSGPVVLKGLTLPAVALENAAAALQATLLLGPVAAADARALCERASSARLPGRFEQRRVGSVDVVLDVAHNPHGAAFLADLLRRAPVAGATLAVMGCLKDKDAAGIVAALDAVVDEWTFVDSGTSRGQTGTETLAKVGPTVGGSARTDVESALGDVIGRAAGSDRVLVLGSFDVVRRAREWLECRP